MSADNFIAIVRKGKTYTGYYCCASHSFPMVACFSCLGRESFKTRRLREALDLGQEINTEYGCSVYDWKEKDDKECPCETKKFIGALLEGVKSKR